MKTLCARFLTLACAACTTTASVAGRTAPGVTAALKAQHRADAQLSVDSWRRVPLGLIPDDPLVGSQWHLANTQGWAHANLTDAWEAGWTGAGVTIGVIDDGLQWDHPDLAANYSAADSFDFGSQTPDPDPYPVYENTPMSQGDNHGTAVAGVAVARGGNGVGTTGAAPHAQVAGLRIDFENFYHPNQFADATRHRSVGGGGAIDIKNHSYGRRSPYVRDDVEVAALAESTAAGTIHVISAGNGRGGSGVGDSNQKALQASHHGITVAALAFDGIYAPYSSWGANVFVTAPSGGLGVGVTTTDRTGGNATGGYNNLVGGGDGDPLSDLDYTSTFSGTSASAPLVSGVLALAKEANPRLDARMAKHLLARTSDSTIDADDSTVTSDGGWTTNAAGFRFNQNYGFGLVDAGALVEAAIDYFGVSEAVHETVTSIVNRALPDAIVDDFLPGQLTSTFELLQPGELEELIVELDLQHSYVGDLQATLTSPGGTSSRLMLRDLANSRDNLSWEFTSNAFWGEDPVGEWSLTVEDWFSKDTGVWNSFSVTAVTGSLIAAPEPASWLFVAAVTVGSVLGPSRR